MNLKTQIHNELEANTKRGMATPWLTVEQLVKQIPAAKGRYATVARALRKLREEGCIKSRSLQRSKRYREWTITNGKNNSGQTVMSATPVPVSQPKPATGFKGSPRRFTMCRPANMPTFVQATEDLIDEYVKSERAFSAYDVTTELRQRANDGKVTIDAAETGTVHVSGKDVPKVTHDNVKGIVHEMFHGDELPGYSRNYTGSYWQYELAADDADDSNDSSDDSDDSDDNSGIAVVSVASTDDDDDYDGSPTL